MIALFSEVRLLSFFRIFIFLIWCFFQIQGLHQTKVTASTRKLIFPSSNLFNKDGMKGLSTKISKDIGEKIKTNIFLWSQKTKVREEIIAKVFLKCFESKLDHLVNSCLNLNATSSVPSKIYKKNCYSLIVIILFILF